MKQNQLKEMVKCGFPDSKFSGFQKFSLEIPASLATISATEMPFSFMHFNQLMKDNSACTAI